MQPEVELYRLCSRSFEMMVQTTGLWREYSGAVLSVDARERQRSAARSAMSVGTRNASKIFNASRHRTRDK